MLKGTVRLSSVTWFPSLRATMANSNITRGAAMQRSISSVLRRVIDYSLSLALFFVFEVEESEDAALSVEAEASLCLVAASWRAMSSW